jgi:ubiquinone/menaquinone biosynthesis C-methylase UbiE
MGESYFIDDVFYGRKSVEMAEFARARVDVVLEMIRSEREKAERGLRVLDVGCGDGACSKLFLDIDNEVYGIDKRADRVESAARKGIKAKVFDLVNGLPFEDGFFELVYAAEVLEHVYDTDFLLEEVSRVLKKNGVLIVTVPNIACLPNRIRTMLGLYPKYVAPSRKHWGVGEHVRAFTKDMLTGLLERNGFKVEATKANLVSLIPTRSTRKPWSKTLGKAFPTFGEVLICEARKKRLTSGMCPLRVEGCARANLPVTLLRARVIQPDVRLD